MAIAKITAQGVRGIKGPLRISLDGDSLLLHGDNGTGKSSLERALRWALMGAEGPLSNNLGDQEIHYRTHVQVSADYPRVTVSFVDGSTIDVAPNSVTTSGNGDAVRESCRKARPFLRRAELLDVLKSKPADRFQYLESFLGLDQADVLIRDLADRRSALEGRATQLHNRADAILGAFAVLLPPDYERPLTAAGYAAAATALGKQLHLLAENPGDLDAQHAAVQAAATALRTGETTTRRVMLEQLRDAATEFTDQLRRSPLHDFDDVAKRRRSIEENTAASEDGILLEHALDHFRRGERLKCPVCEQSVNWKDTLKSLEKRNAELEEFRKARAESHQVAIEWHKKAVVFNNLVGRLGTIAVDQADLSDILPRSPAGTDGFITNHPAGPERLYTSLASIGSKQLNGYWQIGAAKLAEVIDQHLRRLPRTEELPQVQMVAGLFSRLRTELAGLQLVESEHRNLRSDIASLDTIIAALRHTRQDVAKETMAAIQGRVAEYYFAIHPQDNADEATGAPSIEVQRHGKGTAFVRGQFVGKEVRDPQWVYSDGHLDTVGMCIFFALRRYRAQQDGDPKIMVLDDIVISVDLGHARRLIDLLRDKFSDHQLIILTHNGLFAHWCKSLIPGLRRLQIKGWTVDLGPRIGEYADALDQLKNVVGQGTAKEIALALMAFLDEWAGEARYAYAVAVPAKYGEEYTLTDIWLPLARNLKEIGKKLGSDLGGAVPLLEVLKDVPAVRNSLAAHENEFAKEFPRRTMVEIADAALKLANALYCLRCRQFVVPVPTRMSPSMMHCPKHHVQYVHTPPAEASPPEASA